MLESKNPSRLFYFSTYLVHMAVNYVSCVFGKKQILNKVKPLPLYPQSHQEGQGTMLPSIIMSTMNTAVKAMLLQVQRSYGSMQPLQIMSKNLVI